MLIVLTVNSVAFEGKLNSLEEQHIYFTLNYADMKIQFVYECING